jgi:hypothetical protein
MAGRKRGKQNPTVTSEVVEGEPIRVGEREIVPVVRVTSHSERRAFVGNQRSGGYGWQFVHVRPIAILERSEAAERQIPIQNQTARALGGLLLAALIIPVLLGVVVHLARKKSCNR